MNYKLPGLLALLFALGMVSCSGDSTKKTPVAQVGKEVLYREDVDREVPPNLSKSITLDEKKNFTRRWVNTELLYLEARRRGLDKLPEIQAELKRVKRSLLANKLLEREFPQKPAIPDSAVEAYYRAHVGSFVRNQDEVRLIYLIFPSKEKAKKAAVALKKSTPQEIQADSSYGLVQNHDTGFIARNKVPRVFAEKIRRFKKGQVAGPFQSDGEFIVVYVADAQKAGSQRSLDEVRPKIVGLLQQEKERDLYHQLLNALKSKQRVIINLKALESRPAGSKN